MALLRWATVPRVVRSAFNTELQADYDLRCAEEVIRPILETKLTT